MPDTVNGQFCYPVYQIDLNEVEGDRAVTMSFTAHGYSGAALVPPAGAFVRVEDDEVGRWGATVESVERSASGPALIAVRIHWNMVEPIVRVTWTTPPSCAASCPG